jgi:aminoglycoside N3'-acetyltransferase
VVDGLVADLVTLGVEPGDVVMVHASLRAVGPVDGGAAGVVAALEQAVGPEGTLLMNLGAEDRWDGVNDRPEADRPGLLADADPFDALVTPADPDVGVLAEVFRTTPGTVVSDHPEGRFGARGRLATELTADVPWDDYYGPGSPLERLVRAGGKVLRLGADPDTVTLTHYAESVVDLPDKRRVRRCRRITGPAGPTIVWVDSFDDSDRIVEWADDTYFAQILIDFVADGRARQGRVGGAPSELLDAGEFVDFAVEWMAERLRPGRPD